MRDCDAQLCTDDEGRVGYITCIGGNPLSKFSVPVGKCSKDRRIVWHGMDTPAIACGKHSQDRAGLLRVFRGHRNRIAAGGADALCARLNEGVDES